MKKTKYLVAIIFLILTQISISAQSKVAHIDTHKLISEMPEVIAAQKQLEQLESTITDFVVPKKSIDTNVSFSYS